MQWFILTIAELKISFKNKESLICCYFTPVVILLVLNLVFKKRMDFILPGLLIGTILITSTFGTTDWIVILRRDGFFDFIQQGFNVTTKSIWTAFFFSRLLIVITQSTILILFSILLKGVEGDFNYLMITSHRLFFSIPLILIGISLSRITTEKNVRQICGIIVFLGLLVFGVFNSLIPKVAKQLLNEINMAYYMKLDNIRSFNITVVRTAIISLWIIIPVALNLLCFEKAIEKR